MATNSSDRDEANRLLDAHHKAEPQAHSPFCARCAFFASGWTGTQRHVTISKPEDVRAWIEWQS